MKKLMKCKACGFIMEEEKVGDVCPACGVPGKMFEPYADKISEQRKKILDRHIHPIMVHAPQAFAFFLLFFSMVVLLINQPVRTDLLVAIRIMAFCLPFTLVGAFFSGLLDGKTRFHRTTTPILKRKIIFGLVFFALSILLMIVSQAGPITSMKVDISIMLLSTGCFVCSIFLGLLGSSLLEAKFPG